MEILQALTLQYPDAVGFMKFLLASSPGTTVSFPLYSFLKRKTCLKTSTISRITNIVGQVINFFPQKLFTFQAYQFDAPTLAWETIRYLGVAGLFLEVEARSLEHFTPKWKVPPEVVWIAVHACTAICRYNLEKLIFQGW